MEFILLVISCVFGLACVALLVIVLVRSGRSRDELSILMRLEAVRNQLAQLQKGLADEFERSRRDSGAYQKDMREETSRSLDNIGKKLMEMSRDINTTLYNIRKTNEEQNERQTQKVADSIALMQQGNAAKLEEMRQTVDEKLTSTLTTRLDSSFKTVSAQLENVHKSLGEMQNLSGGITTNVTALSRILTNVKARGTWAEVQLEGILNQTIPGMFERNYAPNPNSRERVEFAIRIPSGDEGRRITYLPVDSKFPMEDYVRLCSAADEANEAEVLRTRKALEDRVLLEARSISKYINEPVTTPYAIMYLATEGLYAEIASSSSGLSERIQSELNVMIAGPTTITALLNSLSMGFRAVAINEKANEVRQLLAAAKAQYDKFGLVLDKAKRKIEEAGNTLTEAQDRNRIIQKKLRNVESIEEGEAESLLDWPDSPRIAHGDDTDDDD